MSSSLVVKAGLAVVVALGAVSVFANGPFGGNKPVVEVSAAAVQADVQSGIDSEPWALLLAGAAVAIWAGQRRRRID